MSLLDIRSRFHTALDGVGLLLHGAPNYIAYRMGQQSVFGNRFASGDRSYDDLSKFWYFAQTDWSGGTQTPQPWVDTQYYHSTNIDAYTVPGTLRIARQAVSHLGLSSPMRFTCGTEAVVNGTNRWYFGTTDDSDGRPNIYQADSSGGVAGVSTEIMGAADTSIVGVSQLIGRGGYLWALCHGESATTHKVRTWDGSAWAEQSGYINTAAGAFTTATTGCVVNGYLYIFLYDASARTFRVVRTTVKSPTISTDYDNYLTEQSTDWQAIDAMPFAAGFIYLMVQRGNDPRAQLRYYDIDNATESILREFVGVNFPRVYGLGGKLLKESGGNAVITLPRNQIWLMSQSLVLTKIYDRDLFKQSQLTGVTQTEAIDYGCVEFGGRLYWSNLMFDGEVFHNAFRDYQNSTSATQLPLFTTGNGYLFSADSTTRDVSAVLIDQFQSVSLYKSEADANYIVFGNIDTIQSVDKLADSVTLVFDKLATGQEIAVDYCTSSYENSMTWTELGAVDAAIDGITVTTKVLPFPAGTTFKKLWLRVRLNGGGTDTPVLHDFVLAYLPMPDQKKEWSLTVNAGDHLKDLYGTPSGVTGRELRALIEQAWMAKSSLDYQDLDYAQTLLNGSLAESATTITVDSTAGFNDRGRLRIDNEEILYTGKTGTTFTGCTRGARGTEAASHSDNAVVSNAYKVLVSAIQEQVPVMLKGAELEYTLTINLREV